MIDEIHDSLLHLPRMSSLLMCHLLLLLSMCHLLFSFSLPLQLISLQSSILNVVTNFVGP
jgi:hypothetical protein